MTTVVCTSLDAYNASAGIAIEACDTNTSWQKWNRDANNQRLKNLGGFADRCITRIVPGFTLRLDACGGVNDGLQRFTSNAVFVNGNTLSLPGLVKYVRTAQPGDPPQGLCWSAPMRLFRCSQAAGGMDLGAEQSGRARVVWANDIDHWAVETYRRNLGTHIVEGDVTELPVPDVPCDILLAGSPCQDYSTLWNHDGLKTARGNLFRQVARFLVTLRPSAFVLENVPGLLSANHRAAWTLVRHALRAPSSFADSPDGRLVRYDLSAQVVDMADLGVPQNRERLIVVGIRRDVGIRPPVLPAPFAGRHVTVRGALDAIPIPDDAPNHERGLDAPEVVKRLELIPLERPTRSSQTSTPSRQGLDQPRVPTPGP